MSKRIPASDTQDILDAIDTSLDTSRAFRRQLSLKAAERTLETASPSTQDALPEIGFSWFCCAEHYHRDLNAAEGYPDDLWDVVPQEDGTGGVLRVVPSNLTGDDALHTRKTRVSFITGQRVRFLQGLPVPLWETEEAERVSEAERIAGEGVWGFPNSHQWQEDVQWQGDMTRSLNDQFRPASWSPDRIVQWQGDMTRSLNQRRTLNLQAVRMVGSGLQAVMWDDLPGPANS